MSADHPPRRWWWLLVAAVATYAVTLATFPALLRFVGVSHYGHWFLDGYAILAANDAVSVGLNPWAPNALDPLGRPHVYSHWWLHLRDLGLTRAHHLAGGIVLGLGFLGAAFSRLRPRTAGELGWYLAIVCASPVVLAIERANNDLVVFIVLAPVVPCLLSERRGLPWLAVALVAIATALKFYPAAAALILLAGNDARVLRQRLLFGGLALALVGASVAPDLARISGLLPRAEGILTFGSANIFAAIGLRGSMATVAGLVVAVLIATAFLRSRIFSGWKLRTEERGDWWSFILGAALLGGCFFSGSSYGYRWVFAIWLAPLLWRLPRDPTVPAGVRKLARVSAVLLVPALWGDALFGGVTALVAAGVPASTVELWSDRFFLLEQPITWAFFACLIGFLAHFTRESWRVLSDRAAGPRAG